MRAGWTGASCNKDACSTVKCGAHGRCLQGKCDCDLDFAGTNCEKDLCKKLKCGVHGKCRATKFAVGQPIVGECVCGPGYSGALCDVQTSANACTQQNVNCSNHGTCGTQGDATLPECDCDEGFYMPTETPTSCQTFGDHFTSLKGEESAAGEGWFVLMSLTTTGNFLLCISVMWSWHTSGQSFADPLLKSLSGDVLAGQMAGALLLFSTTAFGLSFSMGADMMITDENCKHWLHVDVFQAVMEDHALDDAKHQCDFGIQGTLGVQIILLCFNTGLLLCLANEQSIGGILTGIGAAVMSAIVLYKVESILSGLNDTLGWYKRAWVQKQLGAHAQAAGAEDIRYMCYFWMMSLAVNFMAAAFCTSICLRLQKNPTLAKERSELRNSLFQESASANFNASTTQDDL